MTPQQVQTAADVVFTNRRVRTSNPEGSFGSKLRWYPSAREDADGDGCKGRAPSRAWPCSYLRRCRTRQHCAVLVKRALEGKDVPQDVQLAVFGRVTDTLPGERDPLEDVARAAVRFLETRYRSAFACHTGLRRHAAEVSP
jgi:hypothetical protein